ncbi:F0F1 ATP synthase subunit gamma [Mycoplasmopsis canis UFG4]|uniref:ATP synthase gamma chain n=2 Tax=Mycoplasmopsis canis TaxID=29555 RepID=I1A6T5_9BACT|nr:ATP synthase F1 subunit gamma [Mycoplasmopsis canis]AKF41159.1 ATP synthase F1 subunit gamma [Mycoplasmopsis canis]AMD81273.1 F0F1 ATP synthase subunit gamma [Mycoplasmopsis canis PG 14]EIE40586.1 F0F1 ATP synthase subunit gamma [Mycoplasmopsis canis PG 14]EIE42010.1 F0F1 ATP synthase subunit gamma [Mycoplasmopsis canis UFG1]EIE42206.1 F0F1 ATP synthase subunit gamma [Mycoplasmopsis canis UFG4]
MPNLNGLKNRIQVISNTEKITNAMELVSTSKLRRLRNEFLNIQSYQNTLSNIFDDLMNNIEINKFHSIFPKNNSKSKLFIVITSDLGLCGSYNHNLFKLLNETITKEDKIIIVGSKGVGLVKTSKLKEQVIKSISNIGDKLSYDISSSLIKTALDLYLDNKISEINLIYTEFINNLTQEAVSKKIFPFEIKKNKEAKKNNQVLEFEPDAETVLLNSVPLFLTSTLYSLSFSSKISEMASRRNAMENATNNASELIKELKLEFNRERQGIITQEITEIVSGADAT